MTTTEELEAAYEAVRLEELAWHGAMEQAAQQRRKLETARYALELLIKNSPNRMA